MEMRNQDYIDELLGKYFAKEYMTNEQQKELDDWIKNNQEDFERIKSLINYTENSLYENHTFDAQRAWDKISPLLSEQRHRHMHIWTLVTAVAASVILVWLGTQILFKTSDSENTIFIANRTNQIENHLLPDSSKVTLFPKSEIKCLIAQSHQDRKVELNGKAFFEIKKANGRKFRVNANNVNVEVLGTSFIVDAYQNNSTTVQVRTGHVKVTSEDTSVELLQNEQVSFTGNKIQKERITNTDAVFGFVNQILVFKEESIENVISQIKEVSGIEIEIDQNVRFNAITARLDLTQPQEAIKEIAFLCQCHYEQTDSMHYRLFDKNNP